MPFDILLKDVPKNKNDFNSYPFLIKDHEFTYAYSSTLLKHIIERKIPQNINNKVLAFAPSVSGERSVLGREPKIGMLHGKQEIESINKIIGCKLLFGEEATETKFKELAKNSEVIISDDLDLPIAELMKIGIKKVGSSHPKKVLKITKKEIVTTKSMKLLYYYRNKLNCYDLDKYI